MRGEGARTLHLHIGLPKTASTWLQDQVFPHLVHLRVVSTPRSRLFDEPADREAEGRVMACALRRSARVWRAMGDAVMGEMLGPREAWLVGGRDLLISDEAIGRMGSRPEQLAAHLRELAPVAARWGLGRLSVICLIRRQDRWLASHYAQMSDRNPRASQRDFEAFARRVTDPAAARHALGALLDYDALREAIAEVAPDPFLMPHEALRDAPSDALGTLLDRLGTPVADRPWIEAASLGTASNVRSGEGSWRLRPRRRTIAGHPRLRVPDWGRGAGRGMISLTSEISARVLEAYAEGNRALDAATGLDLGRLGYFEGVRPSPTELYGR